MKKLLRVVILAASLSFAISALADGETRMSREKIKNYANQQARTVANRVAGTYGKLENWKYNFVNGFWRGFSLYQTFRGSSKYNDGFSLGQLEGARSGNSAGAKAAKDRASELARSDSRARFMAVLNKPEITPDTRVVIPQISFDGLTTTASSPDVEALLDEMNAEFELELRLLAFSSGDFELRYDSWSGGWKLRNVYSYGGAQKYQFLDSWFRDDYAWNEWLANRLGGGYDYNLLNKMDPSERSYFEANFREIYNSVIDEKFYRVRNEYNATAEIRGYYFGGRAASEFAFRSGRAEGYVRGFQEGSRDGFHNHFRTDYTDSFLNYVSDYNTHSVLEWDDVRLIDENRNGVFEAGERVGVELRGLRNIGRVTTGPFTVSLSGNALTGASSCGSDCKLVEVGASTLLSETVVLNSLSQVSMNVQSDVVNTVDIKLGVQNAKATFQVSWETVMRALAVASHSQEIEKLSALIIRDLTTEWTSCLDQWSNWYRTDDQVKTRLEKLLDFISKNPEAINVANLVALGDQIRKIEDEGSWGHPFKRRAFRALAEQIH